MNKEKQIDIVSKYHQKENLANTLYLKQDEFDLSNPFEVANCIINLGYRKITENEVVLTKEQYKELTLAKQSIFKLIDEREDKTRKETAEKFGKMFIINLLNNSVVDEFELEELEFDGEEIREALNDCLKQFGIEIGE